MQGTVLLQLLEKNPSLKFSKLRFKMIGFHLDGLKFPSWEVY